MTVTRARRKAAFQLLYQLDATTETNDEALLASMDELELSDKDAAAALTLARAAYDRREEADVCMTALAPTWPSVRQPAVDRAILRLAHYEMTATDAPPKAVVNDAVEIAKLFSTEKSPAFINGLLDKVLKDVLKLPADQLPPSQPLPDELAIDPNESCPS